MTRIGWGKFVAKQLKRSPTSIRDKFTFWAALVEEVGIREVRKRSGFHDEPLKGKRIGQRSVRLNVAWRVVYVEHEGGEVELLEVLEVNKHDY